MPALKHCDNKWGPFSSSYGGPHSYEGSDPLVLRLSSMWTVGPIAAWLPTPWNYFYIKRVPTISSTYKIECMKSRFLQANTFEVLYNLSALTDGPVYRLPSCMCIIPESKPRESRLSQCGHQWLWRLTASVNHGTSGRLVIKTTILEAREE